MQTEIDVSDDDEREWRVHEAPATASLAIGDLTLTMSIDQWEQLWDTLRRYWLDKPAFEEPAHADE